MPRLRARRRKPASPFLDDLRWIDDAGRPRVCQRTDVKGTFAWSTDDDGDHGEGVLYAAGQWLRFCWSYHPNDPDPGEGGHRPIDQAEAWLIVTSNHRRPSLWSTR